jgi:hypothetical protein
VHVFMSPGPVSGFVYPETGARFPAARNSVAGCTVLCRQCTQSCRPTFSAIFNIAASAFVPILVGTRSFDRANSRFVATEFLAEVVGPPLAGTVVQIVTAPLTIALDAFSFLVSALTLVLVGTRSQAFRRLNARTGNGDR